MVKHVSAVVTALVLGVALQLGLPFPMEAQTTFNTNVRIGYQAGDDWEPYMAADQFGHIYTVLTHLTAKHLQIQRSDDGGNTWTSPVTMDPTSTNTGQFDPWVVIDPADGKTVWVSYMQDNPASAIRVVKSIDFGVTWSSPVFASGSLSGLDKDAMAVRGGTMAACFDDYFHLYGAVSRDGGVTWTQHTMMSFKNAPLQLLCSGAGIDSHGNIFFSWDTSSKRATPGAEVWIEKSSDGGSTWTKTHIDYGGTAYPCSNCGKGAYFGSQMSLSIGSDDTIYLLYNMTPDQTNGAAQRIYFRKSVDHGATYSARQDVSLAATGTEHSFPTVLAASSAGDVRIAWEDKRMGPWNVFYRSSVDGGAAWSAESTASNYVPGYSYLTTNGFSFPYGDYFRLTLDSSGKIHAAWGEASSYSSVGNIWVANQQ